MNIKTKTLIFLIILCIVDMLIPIPILGVILISVVFQKPLWFRDVVSEIYK
jgi:hypothetical protein